MIMQYRHHSVKSLTNKPKSRSSVANRRRVTALRTSLIRQGHSDAHLVRRRSKRPNLGKASIVLVAAIFACSTRLAASAASSQSSVDDVVLNAIKTDYGRKIYTRIHTHLTQQHTDYAQKLTNVFARIWLGPPTWPQRENYGERISALERQHSWTNNAKEVIRFLESIVSNIAKDGKLGKRFSRCQIQEFVNITCNDFLPPPLHNAPERFLIITGMGKTSVEERGWCHRLKRDLEKQLGRDTVVIINSDDGRKETIWPQVQACMTQYRVTGALGFSTGTQVALRIAEVYRQLGSLYLLSANRNCFKSPSEMETGWYNTDGLFECDWRSVKTNLQHCRIQQYISENDTWGTGLDQKAIRDTNLDISGRIGSEPIFIPGNFRCKEANTKFNIAKCLSAFHGCLENLKIVRTNGKHKLLPAQKLSMTVKHFQYIELEEVLNWATPKDLSRVWYTILLKDILSMKSPDLVARYESEMCKERAELILKELAAALSFWDNRLRDKYCGPHDEASKLLLEPAMRSRPIPTLEGMRDYIGDQRKRLNVLAEYFDGYTAMYNQERTETATKKKRLRNIVESQSRDIDFPQWLAYKEECSQLDDHMRSLAFPLRLSKKQRNQVVRLLEARTKGLEITLRRVDHLFKMSNIYY